MRGEVSTHAHARPGQRRHAIAVDYEPWTRGKLTARLSSTRRRFDIALERTATFLEHHPRSHVAWSGGKDSTVVAHLATAVNPTITLAHYCADWCFPETHDYIDDLVRARSWRYAVYRTGDALDAMRANGSWDHAAPDGEDRWAEVTLHGPGQLAYADHPDGMLWGMRAAESRVRLQLLGSTRGIYQRTAGTFAGQWCCSPIWDWSTDHVWAYLAHHDIPPSPLYVRQAELGVPQIAQRTSLVISSAGLQYGRATWLKRGWPDLFARAVSALPRLAQDT